MSTDVKDALTMMVQRARTPNRSVSTGDAPVDTVPGRSMTLPMADRRPASPVQAETRGRLLSQGALQGQASEGTLTFPGMVHAGRILSTAKLAHSASEHSPKKSHSYQPTIAERATSSSAPGRSQELAVGAAGVRRVSPHPQHGVVRSPSASPPPPIWERACVNVAGVRSSPPGSMPASTGRPQAIIRSTSPRAGSPRVITRIIHRTPETSI